LPFVADKSWAAMTLFAVGCMECRFDRQVCGNKIEFR
jgi:hypothetical protein